MEAGIEQNVGKEVSREISVQFTVDVDREKGGVASTGGLLQN